LSSLLSFGIFNQTEIEITLEGSVGPKSTAFLMNPGVFFATK